MQAALTACTVVRLHHDDDDVQAQAAGLASAEEFGDLSEGESSQPQPPAMNVSVVRKKKSTCT